MGTDETCSAGDEITHVGFPIGGVHNATISMKSGFKWGEQVTSVCKKPTFQTAESKIAQPEGGHAVGAHSVVEKVQAFGQFQHGILTDARRESHPPEETQAAGKVVLQTQSV